MGCLQLAANCSKLETLRINNFSTLSDNHLRVILFCLDIAKNTNNNIRIFI
jgi:hypothetical protein